jgi:hypothetical protein
VGVSNHELQGGPARDASRAFLFVEPSCGNIRYR